MYFLILQFDNKVVINNVTLYLVVLCLYFSIVILGILVAFGLPWLLSMALKVEKNDSQTKEDILLALYVCFFQKVCTYLTSLKCSVKYYRK